MKIRLKSIIFAHISIIILVTQLFAQRGKIFEDSYEAKSKLKIKLVLGSALINKSPDSKIHVKVSYTYADEDFEIRVRDKGKTLHLQEKIYGENTHGDSDWTISLPDDIDVDFGTATGELTIEDVVLEIDGNSGTGNIYVSRAAGEFELNSGTGSLEISDSEGDFELNSGTGRVKIRDCNGEFDVNSGTGNVYGANLKIKDDARFNSGTGDAEVLDPSGEEFDLSINSGTGDATLELDNTPLVGFFEFKTSTGRIKSPVDFDEEKEYSHDHNGSTRKSFTKGKKSPRYYISSGSGTAELKN
jgi:hypothetical protein